MSRLTIRMIAQGVDVPGQGVGSAYHEQVALLRAYASDALTIEEGPGPDGDINHFNTVDPRSYLRLLRTRVPSVMHVHFLPHTLDGSISIPKPFFHIFKKYVLRFYRRADHLVVVNPIFIDELARLDIPKERVHYIPNYVSREDFHVVDDLAVQPIRDAYGLDPSRFTVLGVGQVQTRKGVQDFAEVARRLHEVQFVWCGGFSFGKITDGYDELKALVDAPPANLTFTGIVPREQMNLFYNAADMLFMPSYNELFPMAILEAANLHRPILVRDLSLYENILKGNYLKADDCEGFTAVIRELATSEAAREQAADASAAIEHFYSPEHVSRLWVEFYRAVAGGDA